jgi:hypothetical protein
VDVSAHLPAPAAALRTVTKDSARARWLKGVPEDKQATLIPPDVFDQWWNATIATDPVGGKMEPQKLRAAKGVIVEVANYWMAGKPYFDPGRITAPALLIHAEWNADLPTYMAEGYFAKLTGAPYKRFVQFWRMHAYGDFFHEILGFLTEPDVTALK